MIRLIRYNPEKMEEYEIPHGGSIPDPWPGNEVNWFIADLQQNGEVNYLAEQFALIDLVVEDIKNVEHLPKYELLDNGILLIVKRLRRETEGLFDLEHTSFVLCGNNLLTFTPNPENKIINELRNRISKSLGRVRKENADYLLYRFVDLAVDEYLGWTEEIRERIEVLDEEFDGEPGERVIMKIRGLKNTLGETRKYIYPLRDQVARIKTDSGGMFRKNTLNYLQDVIDHLANVNSSFESFREMLKDLTDLHLSFLSQSTNKVMKTLTIVASIFIPLTFIAGVYGMNFRFMPELEQPWGYPAIVGVMLVASLGLLIYMKRKKWF